MRSIIIGFAIATALVGAGRALAADPPPTDYGHLAAYVDWTNDYRFAGASESSRQPEPQGGLHWLAPDNFYLGVFTSGVRFKDFRNTSYEVDIYGGKHFLFDSNDVNLELLYGSYPDSAGHPSYLPPGATIAGYNFFETSAAITHTFGKFTLGGRVIFEPRPQSHGGILWAVDGNASYAVTNWLKLGGEFGNQWEDRGPRGLRWDVGATASFGWQWAFDLRYYGTSSSEANCYGTNWCKPALVGKITYTFLVF